MNWTMVNIHHEVGEPSGNVHRWYSETLATALEDWLNGDTELTVGDRWWIGEFA